MIITLTGFMGCGKSSVGRRLSELLGWRFMDLDEVIEAREGRRIPEIFAAEGEAAFRAMELETLKMVINDYGNGNLVLALGGGTVMTPECARMVHEHTYCIYLRATVETLLSHLSSEADGRPMLRVQDNQVQSPSSDDSTTALRRRISELMILRSSTYESVSRLTIDTDGRVIEEIAHLCAQI